MKPTKWIFPALLCLAGASSQAATSLLAPELASFAVLGAGTTLGADLTGLTLLPGTYTVLAGTSNLTGEMTLDGGGNANAFWVFQMPSTLISDRVNAGDCAGSVAACSFGLSGGLSVTEMGGLPDALAYSPVSVVPEPETYSMLLAGLGLIGAALRRRKDQTS